MSVVSNNILAGASGQGGAGYEIERSLRFNSGDSAYLNRTPSAAGNRKTFTWSGWVKRSNITESAEKLIFGAGTSSGSNVDSLSITAADQIRVFSYGGSYVWQKITTAVFRDPSAWYHIVYSVDTTNATAEDRVKIYVNGVRLTTFGTNTNPTQNADAAHTNTTNAHYICKYLDAAIYANSYLADVHFIDGQALAPTDFGETDDNGVWQPKEFAGTYNAPASFPSYPHVTINPTALGSGSDISHINGGGTYFYSNAQSGAGSVKVEFENPITGVTNIKYNGGAYSVNAIYNIKINGTDVFTNLSTASNWAQVSHTISSTDISSFEIYTANDGWSLYNLLFNDTSPSGTASLESTAGVNGFHLDFADNSSNAALGTDTSGNSNTWTVNNLSVAAGANNDSLVDTPTNGDPANDTGAGGEITGNYATLNPLYTRSSATFSDGNLKLASSTYYSSGVPTISLDNGKWYFEGQIITDGANGYSMIGVTTAPENETYSGGGGGNEEGFGWYSATGGLYPITGSYSSWAVGDVVSVAYDSVTRKTWLAKNGTWQNSGDPAAGTGSVATIPGTKTAYFSIATGTNGVVIANFGQRPFAYAAPSGYKCLNTANLPDPTIADGSQYFDTKLYTGNGSTQSITGYNFSPDFVWLKSRNQAYNHYLLDQIRGAGKVLHSNNTDATQNQSDTLTSFNSDGFSLDSRTGVNSNNNTFVAWAWDGGDLVTNSAYNQSRTWSDESITSTGSIWSIPPNAVGVTAKNIFDGTLTTSVGPYSTGTLTVPFGTTFSGTKTWRVYWEPWVSGETIQDQSGNTLVTATGATKQWYSFSGTDISGLKFTANGSANSSNIYAIEADGKILVDTGVIPAAGLNSSLYDQSQTWSGQITGSNYSGYPKTQAFNNDITNYCLAGAGSELVFTPSPSFSSATTVKIWYYMPTTDANAIKINGTGVGNEVATTGSILTHTFTVSGFTSLSWSRGYYGTEDVGIARIDVDGVQLVDSGVTLPNVPSIASTVRANPSAGFSIVKGNFSFVGDGTLAHGLNAAPVFYVIKNIDTSSNWYVYTTAVDGTLDFGYLNTTGAFAASSRDLPTSSVIQYSSTATGDHLVYCFAPVEGYSAMGSYTGNGSADGPFVFTGHSVAWVMIKRTDAVDNWVIYDVARDTYNIGGRRLYPDLSNAEVQNTSHYIDILSNGFKVRSPAGGMLNASGGSYIYMSFASNPFASNGGLAR
jgi:hypothetical protein